jgi:hypothetical protein
VFETLRRNKKSAVVKQEVEEKPASFAFLFRKTYWGVKEILSPEVLAHDKIAHHYLFQQVHTQHATHTRTHAHARRDTACALY